VAEWERVARKPPVSAQNNAWEDLLDHDWCLRLFALRREGKIGIVLAEWGALYLAESEIDPWGSARRIPAAELRRMIVEIEESLAKENAA
jgi:hypothetical protein